MPLRTQFPLSLGLAPQELTPQQKGKDKTRPQCFEASQNICHHSILEGRFRQSC